MDETLDPNQKSCPTNK